MFIEIIELKIFKRSIKNEKIAKSSVDILKTELRENPEKGDVISNSGGLRKTRMPLENRGNRGGARVIYLYLSMRERIYLISSYKKSTKENLTSDDLKEFRKLIKLIKNMEN